MNRFLTKLCLLAALMVLAALPAISSPAPLPPKDQYDKMVKVQSSKIGDENISRYFYGDTLVKEVFFHGKEAPAQFKSVKTVWEDKGTRWECLESEGQSELKKTVIYKRGINRSGNLEGRRVDDVFSKSYLFDRGWDYEMSRLRARIIADGHILQILMVRAASGTIEKELLFSDPELGIERVAQMEDAGAGNRILLHVLFRDVLPRAGSLVLFDSDGTQTLLGRKVTRVELSPGKRFCAFNAIDEKGLSTLEVFKIGSHDPEFVKNIEQSLVTSLKWSPDERFVIASLSMGEEKKCARVDIKRREFQQCADGACEIASSPSCRFVLYAKKNQKYSGMKITSIDREARRAVVVDEKGSTHDRSLDEIADFSTLHCYDFESGKCEMAGTALSPNLEAACWSRDESDCCFLDGNHIYTLSVMTKAQAPAAVAGFAGAGKVNDGKALYQLEKDLFLVQVDSTIYRIKGFKSIEPFIQKAVSFKASLSGAELAYLVRDRGGFGLSLFNMKNRDELSLIEGGREVYDYQWLARSAAALRVVLQPDLVSADDPVVIHFSGKGDEVPLDVK
ncbi:MAG: hypothetical protein AB2L14_05405 [Candidatus Xenobiia bacterium LiM19]